MCGHEGGKSFEEWQAIEVFVRVSLLDALGEFCRDAIGWIFVQDSGDMRSEGSNPFARS